MNRENVKICKEDKDRYRKIKSVLGVIAILIVIIAILAFDVRLMTVYYLDHNPKIKSSVRIALVTDLHSCYYGKQQHVLIDAINKERPDVILLGGDIFDDEISYKNSKIFIRYISKKYKCYYVTGNHEFWSNDCNNIIDYLKSEGVSVLQGDYQTIRINEDYINICGVDDPDVRKYEDFNDDMFSQLERLEKVSDNNYYTILLAHRPEYVKTYLSYGFDMILCGHAHGGQWRFPPFINGLYAPGQGIFPKYAGGEYTFQFMDDSYDDYNIMNDFDMNKLLENETNTTSTSKMIVSRGLARESTRIPRIFNRPELVIIDLK